MGKIKGWTKLSELEWINDNYTTLEVVVHKNNNWIKVNDIEISPIFQNKTDAMTWAIKYMKSHPRG